MASTKKTSICPICEKPSAPREPANPYPFCSERCKLVDLGKWLDGNYAIPGDPDTSLE